MTLVQGLCRVTPWAEETLPSHSKTFFWLLTASCDKAAEWVSGVFDNRYSFSCDQGDMQSPGTVWTMMSLCFILKDNSWLCPLLLIISSQSQQNFLCSCSWMCIRCQRLQGVMLCGCDPPVPVPSLEHVWWACLLRVFTGPISCWNVVLQKPLCLKNSHCCPVEGLGLSGCQAVLPGMRWPWAAFHVLFASSVGHPSTGRRPRTWAQNFSAFV